MPTATGFPVLFNFWGIRILRISASFSKPQKGKKTRKKLTSKAEINIVDFLKGSQKEKMGEKGRIFFE